MHRIAQTSDRSFDPRITKLVDACKKIHFMRSGAVWLVSSNWGPAHDEVYNIEVDYQTTPAAAGRQALVGLCRRETSLRELGVGGEGSALPPPQLKRAGQAATTPPCLPPQVANRGSAAAV